MNLVRRIFTLAFAMLKAPSETLAKLVPERTLNTFSFLVDCWRYYRFVDACAGLSGF